LLQFLKFHFFELKRNFNRLFHVRGVNSSLEKYFFSSASRGWKFRDTFNKQIILVGIKKK